MSKNKKNKESLEEQPGIGRVTPLSDLDIVLYTEDSAKRSFPDDNRHVKEEMKLYTCHLIDTIDKILEYIYKPIKTLDFTPELKIHLGVIDDEYYNWLNGRKNTSKLQLRYVSQMSEKKATELLNKYHMGYSLDLYGLPLFVSYSDYITQKKTNFSLTRQQREAIKKCIMKSMPEGTIVYVYDYILNPETFVNESNDIYYNGVRSVREGKDVIRSKYHTQKFDEDEYGICRYYIPILIGTKATSALIDTHRWFDGSVFDNAAYYPDDVYFAEDEDKWEDARPCAETFDEAGLDETLSSAFDIHGYQSAEASLDPYVIMTVDVADNEKCFREALEEYVRELQRTAASEQHSINSIHKKHSNS